MENAAPDKTFFTALVLHPRFQLALIVLFSINMLFAKLGGNGLANYDDCFYAQKAKEFLHSDSWMTMRHNGMPAFENPPLFIWMIAGSYKIFGINEYAAKFPSALMGVMTILLLYYFVRRKIGNLPAFLSAFVLATTFAFTGYARHAMIDVTLTFFFSLSIYAMMLATEKDSRYFILWGFAIACCILAKSVLGLFPMIITVLYLLASKQWRFLLKPYFVLGCCIALVLGSLWYLHQWKTFGIQFLGVHLGWLIFKRGLGSEGQHWYEHLSYLKGFAIYYWPWLPVFLYGLVPQFRKIRSGDLFSLLLVLWFAVPVFVMSLMDTRVFWYIMPVFFPASVICGWTLETKLSQRGTGIFLKIATIAAALSFVVINATPLRVEMPREQDMRTLAPYVKHFALAGGKITAYRADYYGLNNALLFYSDFSAGPIYREATEVSEAFKDSTLILCLVYNRDFDSLRLAVNPAYVLRRTDDISLIANKELNISDVKTW